MFGYVRPCKPQLRVCEFETFQAVYCGLCKQLSRTYTPLASLTLSYDFTFIALLFLGMSEGEGSFQKCACAANPLRRKMCLLPCGALSFSASAAMLLFYHKLRDDAADEGFLRKAGSKTLLPAAFWARRKAAELYPKLDEAFERFVLSQNQLEKEGCASLDRAADPTAGALAALCEQLSENAAQQQILHRFGYILGRYVYFADALDDLEADQKSGSYNPFLMRYADELSLPKLRQAAQEVINLTIGELASAYELLDIKRYKPILDNVIYLGLHSQIHDLLQKKAVSLPDSGPLER